MYPVLLMRLIVTSPLDLALSHPVVSLFALVFDRPCLLDLRDRLITCSNTASDLLCCCQKGLVREPEAASDLCTKFFCHQQEKADAAVLQCCALW